MPKQSSDNSPASRPIPSHSDLPRGWQWLGKFLIWFVVSRSRRRALREERVRLPILESTIETAKSELIKARERGADHTVRVFNVGLFVLLMDRDFAVLKVDMVSSFEKWRLRFTARQAALLLYEACDDLKAMLGKDFRDSLVFLGASEAEMKELGEISHRLSKFKSANHDFLYNEVRKVVAAHREQDSLLFLQTVENLDPTRVFQLVADFFGLVNLLTDFLIKAIVRTGQPQNVLKQLLASPKFMASLEAKQRDEHPAEGT